MEEPTRHAESAHSENTGERPGDGARPRASAEESGTTTESDAAAHAAKASGDSQAPIRIDPGPDGILYLTFDHPERKVNVFTFEVLTLLDHLLDELSRASDANAVIARSFKPDCFIAGADLEAIAGVRDKTEGSEASRFGQRVFAKVETLRLPVIAAIDGVCLGGGAEFALACHYRLLADRPSTRIAFPEVRLGILPAFGGTQRLPQIVGVRRALDLILSGRSVNPRRARAMGLADEVYPPDLFADRVLAFTQQVVTDHRGPRRARPQLAFGDRMLEGTKLGRMILFRKANEQIYATTDGHYPAPPAALAAVRTGIERGNRAGYAVEARSAAELLTSPVSRNLVGLFFQSEAVKKSSGVVDPDVEPRPVRELGIIGAGIMGGGITHAATKIGLPVRMKDVKHEAILGALRHMRKLSDREIGRRRATPAEVERRFNRVAPTLTYRGFRRADLVIEAVVEDLAIKQAVFKELESAVREDCIIASNTSSLSVTTMASVLDRPERFFGLHFFNPVDRMLLVEVVRGQRTDDQTVATGFEFAKRLGKTPIVVGDRPGFLVNRILMPYLNEGCRLLEEGFTIEIVDRAMKNFGMPMGPLALLDEVGLDVAVRAATSLASAYSDRLTVSPLLQALVERGRLGKKAGLGFYRGAPGSKRLPDPEVARIVESLPPPVVAGTKGDGVPELATSLQERLLLPMINEAARCLTESVVRKPSDVDLGLVFGIGFPPFRGGLLRYADELEVPAVVDRMRAHVDEGRAHYAPAPLLVEMAEQGRRFYQDR